MYPYGKVVEEPTVSEIHVSRHQDTMHLVADGGVRARLLVLRIQDTGLRSVLWGEEPGSAYGF